VQTRHAAISNVKQAIFFLLSVVSLVALPLAGLIIHGKRVGRFLKFPRTTQFIEHAPFSWLAFFILAAIILVFVSVVYLVPLVRNRGVFAAPRGTHQKHPFPYWGWIGLGLGIFSWGNAWMRVPGLSFLRPHMFVPLWLGYILVISGLTYRRQGSCLMLVSKKRFVLLFVLSAVFWWYFEYLGRFVQNWNYVGVKPHISAAEYAIRASLSFSTVLPAVLATQEYLSTFAWMNRYSRSLVIDFPSKKALALGLLALSFLTMLFLGLYADYLFPMLWVSPLFIVTSFQVLTGQKTVFADISSGDWRLAVSLSLAALVCGFFWEMWNVYASPKWVYAIPFVDAFHVFEMPILGYAGYLPFGLECYSLAQLWGPMSRASSLDGLDRLPTRRHEVPAQRSDGSFALDWSPSRGRKNS
jgi:hypothetical protein